MPRSEANVVGKSVVLGALAHIPGGSMIVQYLGEKGSAKVRADVEDLKVDVWEIRQIVAGLEASLGADPKKATEAGRRLFRVSQLRHEESCFAVMELLSGWSLRAQSLDPLVPIDDAELHLSLASVEDVIDIEQELRMVVHELDRHGLVKTINAFSGPSLRFSPTDAFFWKTDPWFRPWDPSADAVALCKMGGIGDYLRIRELDPTLGWGPRRMNPALLFMYEHGLTDQNFDRPHSTPGIDFVIDSVRLTAESRYFLEEASRS